MIVKTISFPAEIDKKPTEKDLKEMDYKRKEIYDNAGLGKFFIKIYREWGILKAREDALKMIIEDGGKDELERLRRIVNDKVGLE
jgi:hypothetical protein